MNMIHRLAAASLLAGLSFAAMAGSGYKYLDIEQVTQEHSQWCWAASSVDVLRWYGKNPTQCGIVNWAFGRNDACTSASFNWNSYANQPNSLYGTYGSVQDILASNGVRNQAYASASSWSAVVSDVNANRPFVIRFGWYGGGGHIMVGYGYHDLNGTQMIGYMNPWPGEGYTWSSYSWTVYSAYDHSWTHTLRMQQ